MKCTGIGLLCSTVGVHDLPKESGWTLDRKGSVMMTRLLHPIPEALTILGIGRSTFFNLVAAGEIQPVKIGRRTLVPHDELERFVRELAKSSTTDPAA